LNGDCAYPATKRIDNQLRALNHIGMFKTPLTDAAIAACDRLVPVTDTKAPLEKRVRSYLDANCAQCHRPGGVQAYFDARFETPLVRQGLLNGQLANPLGAADAKVIAPQETKASVLHARLSSNDAIKMPTLARNVVDVQAVATLQAWIAALPRDAGTRLADQIAVLTNHDVHIQQRSRTGTAMYLSERADAIVRGGDFGREELAVLRTMLRETETFVVAHVLLSAKIDGVTTAGNREVNGLLIQADYRDTVTIDPEQRGRLAEYWAGKLGEK